MTTVTIQRIVFPAGFELPAPAGVVEGLYFKKFSQDDTEGSERVAIRPPEALTRTTARVARGAILSTDTYFNRVHAGYWQRWTQIEELTVSVEGSGMARMAVRRSTANGDETTIRVVEGDLASGLSYTVDLAPTAGGGCLWIEVEPLDDEIVVSNGRWHTEADSSVELRTDVAVCTFDRPEDVLALLKTLRRDTAALEVIDRVWVVDNGKKQFSDLADSGWVIAEWGDRLNHVEQPNLGGSGGFARGMFEAAYNGDSPFVMLLDDDVVVEPEGLRRAVVFGALAKRPIAVGAQMLNRADPTVLHSIGEWVDTNTIRWGVAPGSEESVELEEGRLDVVIDVAFNAWWSCLIPTDAIRKVGLGMPFFIKYDDVEFGYRLARGGFRTVTLPGSAVWHEPWTLKDDTTDWTLYFHVRNRLIFAALMSAGLPEKVQKRRVNTVIQDILKRDIVRNVLRRAYASAASAELAMRDFLDGPGILNEPLQECVARVRQARLAFPDAATDVPTGGRGETPTTIQRRKGPRIPVGMPRSILREYGIPVPKILPIPIHLLPRKQSADAWRIWEMPKSTGEPAELPKVADHWWGLIDVPDAWVTTVDGARVTRRVRTPALSRVLTRRAMELSKEVKLQFAHLSEEYAAAVPHLTSIDAWSRQFGIEVE